MLNDLFLLIVIFIGQPLFQGLMLFLFLFILALQWFLIWHIDEFAQKVLIPYMLVALVNKNLGDFLVSRLALERSGLEIHEVNIPIELPVVQVTAILAARIGEE